MLERTVVADIPADVTFEALLKAVRMNGEDAIEEDVARLREMYEESAAIARPKAIYGVARITEKGEDSIVVEGHKIASALVRENVGDLNRIFPFVITCGTELEAWSQQFTDFLEQFWADAIKLQYLGAAGNYINRLVREKYIPKGYLTQMNPGSVKEWPLTQQAVLFHIVGNVEEDIGVHLTDSFLMLPSKSRSGFYFPSDSKFENCSLCPILDCPGRRVPYGGQEG